MSEQLPPDQPTTLAELLWYCRHYQNQIYFRVLRGGRWEAVALAKLTAQEYGQRLQQVIEVGIVPARVPVDI